VTTANAAVRITCFSARNAITIATDRTKDEQHLATGMAAERNDHETYSSAMVALGCAENDIQAQGFQTPQLLICVPNMLRVRGRVCSPVGTVSAKHT